MVDIRKIPAVAAPPFGRHLPTAHRRNFVRFRFLVGSRLGNLTAPKCRMSEASMTRQLVANDGERVKRSMVLRAVLCRQESDGRARCFLQKSSIVRRSMCACSSVSSSKRESVGAIRKLAELRSIKIHSRVCFETLRIAFRRSFRRAQLTALEVRLKLISIDGAFRAFLKNFLEKFHAQRS